MKVKQTSVLGCVALMVGRSDGSVLQNDLVIPGERMERINAGRRRQGEEREGTVKRGTLEEQNEVVWWKARGRRGRDEYGGKAME